MHNGINIGSNHDQEVAWLPVVAVVIMQPDLDLEVGCGYQLVRGLTPHQLATPGFSSGLAIRPLSVPSQSYPLMPSAQTQCREG